MNCCKFVCIFTWCMCSAELQNFYEDSINEESTPFSCIKDSVLRCKADRKNAVKYRAVTWYKVSNFSKFEELDITEQRIFNSNVSLLKWATLYYSMKVDHLEGTLNFQLDLIICATGKPIVRGGSEFQNTGPVTGIAFSNSVNAIVTNCERMLKRMAQAQWCIVNKDPPYQLSGLLTRKLSRPNSTRCYICLQREVLFLEESFDIFLPNVTSDDIGTYKCLLEAHVGEQNQEGLDHISVAGCPGNKSMGQIKDMYLVVAATVVLIVALMIFVVCYATLKSILNQRLKKNFKERLLDTHVGKNDLESINTLGSCWSRQATKPTTMKYMCV